MPVERVFLVGLSGSGKSTVGRLVAERLGWQFVDTDAVVEQRTGRTVETVFAEEGEAAFRLLEATVLGEIATRSGVVVATGGGAPTSSAGREAIATGLVIWLDVTPERAASRLAADSATAARPLLAGDPLARLEALFEARRPLYEQSDHSIAVDYYSPAQVAERIVTLVGNVSPGWKAAGERFGPLPSPAVVGIAATVATATARYPVYVREGVLDDVGAICREVGLAGRAFVLTDATVAPLFALRLETALAGAGYATSVYAMPPGEQHKNLGTVASIYDWLLGARLERSDFLVCLGGGVVTDVGGFAAATALRGVPFVHVPTTMAGMVDAAIGGKTGVDHPRGKNLVGAFAQPRAVVIDPTALATLPVRELRGGCAELIKHGFILDEGLVSDLERTGGDPARMASAPFIARSVAIKAVVVSGDEREEGVRTLLNYGHTVGHAIEAVTGYRAYLHGEAVAIGMRAAGLIAMEMGMLAPGEFERQQALVRACGLPESAPGISAGEIIAATLGDKKVRGGRVRWVLLAGLGRAAVREDVPQETVARAVASVVRADG